MSSSRRLPLLFAALLACDGPDADPAIDAADPRAGKSPASARPPAAAPPAAAPPAVPTTPDLPIMPVVPVMPDARRAFARTLELIRSDYVDREIAEDVLYTGALEGMLARLIQLGGHPVNELLDPPALAELLQGSAGAIVGVGVEIAIQGGALVVVHPIPGGPAEQAGLLAGDRILGIDGARTRDVRLADLVDKIRGKPGTTVDLFVQRDTEEWHQPIVRASIALTNVESRLLEPELGYLRLRGFAETTLAQLDAAIAELQTAGMQALVLDLRDCPGGVFDVAIAVAGRFLADGATIVSLVDRDNIRTTRAAAGDGRWHDLRLAVLIGPDTASGAEILADALATHGRATLIGQPTLGKGTVEVVHELGNGWALKLSSHRFIGASGEPIQGRGVRPLLPVTRSELIPVAELPGDDDAVAAARTWLAGQPR